MKSISDNLSYKLTVVNIVMTILIVWLHAAPFFQIDERWVNIAIVAVPCFFCISSFLYFFTFDFSDIGNSYKNRLKTRVKSLLIPFFIFNIFGFLFGLLASKMNSGSQSPLYGINDFADILKYVYRSGANGPLWYLRALFEFVLIAPLLGIAIKYSKWSILLLIPLSIVGINCSYFSFAYWIVDIFLGAYIAIWWDEIIEFNNDKQLLKYIKLGGVILGIGLLFSIKNEYVLRCVTPLVVILIMGPAKLPVSSFIKRFGAYTMLIYCLHLPVLRIVSKFPALFRVSNPLMALVLSTILTVIGIVVIGKIIKTKKPVWNLLTGGRSIRQKK